MLDRASHSPKRKRKPVEPRVISVEQVEKERADGRRRSQESRDREHKAKEEKKWFDKKPDKEVGRNTKLLRSELAEAVSEMEMRPGADQWLSYAELRALDGKAIAAVVRWALPRLRDERRRKNRR